MLRNLCAPPVLLGCFLIPYAWSQVTSTADNTWKLAMSEGMKAAGEKDYARAEQAFQHAVKMAEGFGPQDPRVGTSLNSLGLTYRAEHKLPEAESTYRRSLAIIEHRYPDTVDVANINFNIANVLLDQGHYDQVGVPMARAQYLYQKLLGPDSLRMASVMCLKGETLRRQNRFNDAEGPLRRCADIREKSQGLNSPELADALESLARNLVSEGKAAIAEPRYAMVEKIRENTGGLRSLLLAQALEEHAAVLQGLGKPKEAEKRLAMAAAIRRSDKK